MELLLSTLPAIFAFFTGILIAWGGFAGYKTVTTMYDVIDMGRKVRHSDMYQAVCLLSGTVLLVIVLFVTPQFAAFHIDTILFLEILYSLFLINVTESAFVSFEPLKQIKAKHIHFH